MRHARPPLSDTGRKTRAICDSFRELWNISEGNALSRRVEGGTCTTRQVCLGPRGRKEVSPGALPGLDAPNFSGIAVWSGKSADHCFSTSSAALAWGPNRERWRPSRERHHRTSRNFFHDRCSMCRREHDRSVRHQRLSLDLIAGDCNNMGCRGELTSRRGKRYRRVPNQMPATNAHRCARTQIARRAEQIRANFKSRLRVYRKLDSAILVMKATEELEPRKDRLPQWRPHGCEGMSARSAMAA